MDSSRMQSGSIAILEDDDDVAQKQLSRLLNTISLAQFSSRAHLPNFRRSQALIVAHAHVLPSFFYLIEHLINNAGFVPNNIIVIPKSYSAMQQVIDKVREIGVNVLESPTEIQVGFYDQAAATALKAACRMIEGRLSERPRINCALLLDDGGLLTEHWYRHQLHASFRTISIQQTTSGIHRPPTSSVIQKLNVAGSAAKRWFEASIIAQGVVRKVTNDVSRLNGRNIGIVGYGSIGRALAKSLKDIVRQLTVYDYAVDQIPLDLIRSNSLRDVVSRSTVIFGCTGRNIFSRQKDFLTDYRDQIDLISCSSRDIEFQTLLQHRYFQTNNPFGDIAINDAVTIFNGGFPINFDRCREWETALEIGITRALVLGAIYQAIAEINEVSFKSYSNNGSSIMPLDTNIQRHIVKIWLEENDRKPEHFGVGNGEYNSASWWEKESFGPKLSNGYKHRRSQ